MIGGAKSYEEAYNACEERVKAAAEDYFSKLERVQKAKDLDYKLNSDEKLDVEDDDGEFDDNPALQPDPNFQYGAQQLYVQFRNTIYRMAQKCVRIAYPFQTGEKLQLKIFSWLKRK